MDDFVRAAWRYLIESDEFAQLVESDVIGRDAPGGPYSAGWAFRSKLDGTPFREIENTGTGAISLYSYDSWSTPNRFHSSKYPRLHLAIFSDLTREVTSHNPHRYTAEDNVRRIYDKIHPLFHDSANRIHNFSGYPIISTIASTGLSMSDVELGDGVVRGDVVYDLHI